METGPGDLLVELRLSCDEQAPGAVRDALAALPDTGPAYGDAMLVASELVTSAVRRSGARSDDQLEVEVVSRDQELLISVLDPEAPGADGRAPVQADPEATELGLIVVEQLVTEWGEERSHGYRVWARLPLN